jgi:hypothetical protein
MRAMTSERFSGDQISAMGKSCHPAGDRQARKTMDWKPADSGNMRKFISC